MHINSMRVMQVLCVTLKPQLFGRACLVIRHERKQPDDAELRVSSQDKSDQPYVKLKVKCCNITWITFEWRSIFSSAHFKIGVSPF